MKKQLLLLVMMLLPMVASADVVEIDGIYYYLKFVFSDGYVAIVTENPNGYTGSITIPESFQYNNVDYSVTSIGKSAFADCSGLTSVTIPNSVTSIGSYAFQNCSSLTSVTIPNSVTSIDYAVFRGCSGLTAVTIPNSVTSIVDYAFQNCSSLTSVTIPNSVTSMGGYVFYGCSGLTSVTIGNSVTSIEYEAFYGCSGLTSVTIPNSVTSIGDAAFHGCSSLTSVTIPNSVTSLGVYVFCGCSGLTSVTIGNSVTSIGEAAFHGCSSLTSVTIPNSVTSIGFAAFYRCSGLTAVTIPNSVTSIGSYAFDGCSGLTAVTIGNSVTSIGRSAFYGCSGLTSVTIPNSVTSIGEEAFRFCSGLTSVTIGNSVTSIGGSAFSVWTKIEDVYIYAEEVPNTGSDAFLGSTFFWAILHVPSSAVNAYKAAEPWNRFKEIVKLPMFSLTYFVDNEIYESYQIEEGATITPEPAPTKEGYTFSGWSEIPETMPAHDVTVTGTFSINSYKLTYIIDDKVYKETMYEYGSTIIPEPQPEGDYQTFEWTDLPQTMPAHDVVVHASYTSGIIEVLIASQHNVRIYSPYGKKLNRLQKGVNIVILDDGTVKKVIMK